MYWLPYSSHTSHHPSQTPCFPWISYATQKMMLDSCKMVEKQSEAFHTFLWHFFPSLKPNLIAYRSSKMSSRPDCIFEIHQLWPSSFSRVYSNCYRSCSFEEIIKIGQSSHKMYSNNIVNFRESTTILNAFTKKSGNLLKAPRTGRRLLTKRMKSTHRVQILDEAVCVLLRKGINPSLPSPIMAK